MSEEKNKSDLASLDNELNWKDTLKIQGVMAKGYGITPKMVMLDRRLSIEAKAIYSYFCSYAGAGNTAFPSRDKILQDLGIGKDRYYKHFNLLKDTGYIEVNQVRKGKGKFKSNIYTLITNPQALKEENKVAKVPCTDFKDMDGKAIKPPCPDFRDTDKRDSGNRDTENKDTIINSSFLNINKSSNIINNSIYNHQSINQVNDTMDDCKKLIQSNLEYHSLSEDHKLDINQIDELISIMTDVIQYQDGSLNINNVSIPRSEVANIFLQLKGDHIDYVIRSLHNSTTKIKNMRNYLITTLYNSFFTLEMYWRNQVNHDMNSPQFGKDFLKVIPMQKYSDYDPSEDDPIEVAKLREEFQATINQLSKPSQS